MAFLVINVLQKSPRPCLVIARAGSCVAKTEECLLDLANEWHAHSPSPNIESCLKQVLLLQPRWKFLIEIIPIADGVRTAPFGVRRSICNNKF